MKELMKNGKETFRTPCKYSRYVLNDHFVLFMLIFIGFLAVHHSCVLARSPKDTSLIRWVHDYVLLVPSTHYLLREAFDALFLLVKEECEVKRYIKGQAKKSLCFA